MSCLLLGSLSVIHGCRSAPLPALDPGPLQPPLGMQLSTGSFAGTPLGGPRSELRPETLQADPRQAIPVEVEFLYLERSLPESSFGAWFSSPDTEATLDPLALAVDLVVASDRRSEILPTSRLFLGARIGSGPFASSLWDSLVAGEKGRSHIALSEQRVLIGGATATFHLGLTEEVIDSDNFLREYPDREPFPKAVDLRMAIDERTSEIDWLFGLSSAAPRLDPDVELSPAELRFRPGGPAPLQEWVRPRMPSDETVRSFLVLIPSPFDLSDVRTIAIHVVLGDALGGSAEGLPERTQAVVQVVADVQKVAFELTKSALVFGHVPTSTERTIRAALEGLRYATDLRAVFAYLTGVLEPPMALDFVLTASEENLVALAERVATERTVNSDASPQIGFDARWSIERGSWALLAGTALQGDQVSSSEKSLLLRHGGEVGRFPSLIEEALAACSSCEAFQLRLEKENRVFLKDASPAARVRALDWLLARGLAPAGYDPLASRADRRHALDLWESTLIVIPKETQ